MNTTYTVRYDETNTDEPWTVVDPDGNDDVTWDNEAEAVAYAAAWTQDAEAEAEAEAAEQLAAEAEAEADDLRDRITTALAHLDLAALRAFAGALRA